MGVLRFVIEWKILRSCEKWLCGLFLSCFVEGVGEWVVWFGGWVVNRLDGLKEIGGNY